MTVRDNVSFKYIKCPIVNIIGSGKKSPGLFPCRKATDYQDTTVQDTTAVLCTFMLKNTVFPSMK